MPNTTTQEIPIQEHRPSVPNTIHVAPDVNDFLTEYEKGRGDRDHVVNWIIRRYRDSLPLARRGELKLTTTPAPAPVAAADPGAPKRIEQFKKTASGD